MWQLSNTTIYDPATGILYAAFVDEHSASVSIYHPARPRERQPELIKNQEAHELWDYLMHASEPSGEPRPTLLSMQRAEEEALAELLSQTPNP
jgi:hypothetical protein